MLCILTLSRQSDPLTCHAHNRGTESGHYSGQLSGSAPSVMSFRKHLKTYYFGHLDGRVMSCPEIAHCQICGYD